MKTIRKQKLLMIVSALLVLLVAVLMITYALRQNINLFYAPNDFASHKVPMNTNVRLGGMVVKGSVKRDPNSLRVEFKLTDYKSIVSVHYNGILPALFREGQGIVTQGKLGLDGAFWAQEVLAKHDENYMPPEVKASLRKQTDVS